MVLYYAEGGSFNNWIKRDNSWHSDMKALELTTSGLGKIHEKRMVHHDFHIGNILFSNIGNIGCAITYISDMGLCGEVGNIDLTKIYGVMPYVAPELILKQQIYIVLVWLCIS